MVYLAKLVIKVRTKSYSSGQINNISTRVVSQDDSEEYQNLLVSFDHKLSV
jgi:hypothetical protein